MTAQSASPRSSATFTALKIVAALLCLAGCAIILLVPTQSLAVNTVYQGF